MPSTPFFVGLPEENFNFVNKEGGDPEPPSEEIIKVEVLYDGQSLLPEGSEADGVPNAPRGRISEIFSGDEADGRAMNGNGTAAARNGRPARTPRDTPTRPRDTHSRLFGQGGQAPHPAPLITDNIRSNIRFGDGETNGHHSPSKSPSLNGSGCNTPSRAVFSLPRRNPVTGDGITLPQLCRRWAIQRSREGNPITGDGYKSLNGEINTAVTALNGNYMPINHNRIPPGGYSSGLW